MSPPINSPVSSGPSTSSPPLGSFTFSRFFLSSSLHSPSPSSLTRPPLPFPRRSDEKIKFLEGLPDGPTKGINYRTQDFAEIIKSDTSGKGVDVILDFIGKDYFSQNLASLAFDGRLVLLAAMSGPKVPELNLMDILFRRLTIKGTTLRARSEEYQGELLSRFENEALPRIKEGDVEVRIYKVFDWEQVKEAHEMMEANKNSGKVSCPFLHVIACPSVPLADFFAFPLSCA